MANESYVLKQEEPLGSLSISEEYKKPSLRFYTPDNPDPVLVIREGKFILKGEEVNDVHLIYEGFNEWLQNVRKQK